MHSKLVLTSFSLPFKFVHFFSKKVEMGFWVERRRMCRTKKPIVHFLSLALWLTDLVCYKQSITDYGLCVIRWKVAMVWRNGLILELNSYWRYLQVFKGFIIQKPYDEELTWCPISGSLLDQIFLLASNVAQIDLGLNWPWGQVSSLKANLLLQASNSWSQNSLSFIFVEATRQLKYKNWRTRQNTRKSFFFEWMNVFELLPQIFYSWRSFFILMFENIFLFPVKALKKFSYWTAGCADITIFLWEPKLMMSHICKKNICSNRSNFKLTPAADQQCFYGTYVSVKLASILNAHHYLRTFCTEWFKKGLV